MTIFLFLQKFKQLSLIIILLFLDFVHKTATSINLPAGLVVWERLSRQGAGVSEK